MPNYAGYLKIAEHLSSTVRSSFSKFCGLYSKGTFEELVPGLSDMDLRVIMEKTDSKAWLGVSDLSSAVYVELAEDHPEWIRILKQPPGAMMSKDELFDEELFLPEIRYWDFLTGDRKLW